MRLLLVILLLLGNLFPVCAQSKDYQRGVILDSLLVNGNSQETFALYLPQTYSATQLSPIVFIFHPSGRGADGVSHFVKAADKYGYVLVCSNNNKNGPQNVNFDYANRLFAHVFSSFNIDNSRIYTSGFSGGSRLAMAIAVLTKRMAGVIACGSGFPGNVAPVGNEAFSYAGIVGNLDMNYLEMTNNRLLLNALKVSNELFSYDMAHAWPSPDQLVEALDWLQLEAIKKGIIKPGETELIALYKEALSNINTDADPQNLVRKNANYQRIIRNFGPYQNVDSIIQTAKELRASKEYKKQQGQYADALQREKELSAEYTQKFLDDVNKVKPKATAWQKRIDKLFKEITKTEDSFEKRMLQRVIAQVSVTAYETAFSRQGSLSMEQLMFCYDVWIFTAPKNPYGYFIQMRNAMKISDQKLALNYLRRLIDTGYTDYETIANFKPINELQSTQEYQEIIAPLKN